MQFSRNLLFCCAAILLVGAAVNAQQPAAQPNLETDGERDGEAAP